GIAGDVRALAFVRTGASASACDIVGQANGKGSAGAPRGNAHDFPPIESLASEAVRIGEKRNLPDVVDAEGVGNVLVGQGLFGSGVEGVLNGIEGGFGILVRGVGDVTAMGVSSLELQAV